MGNRLLIGMHGRFDEAKLERDFRNGFWGIEVSKFSAADIKKIIVETEQRDICFGVHYPLLRKEQISRDPLLIHPDEYIREAQWQEFEEGMRDCAKVGAEYLIIHMPKPVLLDRTFDPSHCRFGRVVEWMCADTYEQGALDTNLRELFERLSRLSYSYRLPIYLELDFLSTELQIAKRMTDLLKVNPIIGVCIDFARLHIQACIDRNFNPIEAIRQFAPYVRHVHLCNTTMEQNKNGGHYPALPELSPKDGWADLPEYFKALNKSAGEYTLLFEHRSDLITDEQLEECYRFAEYLVSL